MTLYGSSSCYLSRRQFIQVDMRREPCPEYIEDRCSSLHGYTVVLVTLIARDLSFVNAKFLGQFTL